MTNAIVVHAEMDPLAFGRGDHRQDAAGVHQEQGALYRGAEEHDGDVFRHRPHGPEGRRSRARGVLQSSPAVAKANIDLSKTYTNKFVDAANKKMGMK